MKRYGLILASLGLLLTLLPGCVGGGAGEPVSLDDGGEVNMALGDCPPAVQAALKGAAGTGTVESVSRDTEGGRETYSATIRAAGKTRAVNVSSDGRWVGHPDE